MPLFHIKPHRGFTLAELLVCLAILGEIATFTIPKLLSAQQNGSKRAAAKEVVAMISGAHQLAKLNTDDSTAITATTLQTYMNYVSIDTTSTIDSIPNDGPASYSCADYDCFKLHNGGLLLLVGSTTGTVGNFSILFDPDGYRGIKDSVNFYLYGTGRIQTAGDLLTDPSYDPTWFSWN